MRLVEIKKKLDALEEKYNRATFIEQDPICVPHQYQKLQDIEIAGLFAALLAWGQRSTIINNTQRLMELMDYEPHQFIIHHSPQERNRFSHWVHRTFQFDDLLYFLEFLQFHYRQHESLEVAFTQTLDAKDKTVEQGLIGFHEYFFSLEHLRRTEKHLQTPLRKSACKRLNLYLRWMVRSDERGVDFGLWKKVKMSQLLCPLDVHVQRAAMVTGLLKRKQSDWLACLELTSNLRKLNPEDPVKYDYALFGMSIEKQF